MPVAPAELPDPHASREPGTDFTPAAPGKTPPPEPPAAARRRGGWWWRGLVVAGILLLATITAVVWLATRPDGLQRALRMADGLGGTSLDAQGVAGPVAGPFQVQRLIITHRRATITIDGLRGELRLGALVYGTLGVRELVADRVQVSLHPRREMPQDTGFLPGWLRVSWDHLRVARLDITGSGQPVALRDLEATGSLTRWTLRVQPLSTRWQQWIARGQLRLDAGRAVAVDWQGQLEGPVFGAGPPWKGMVELAGEVPANAPTTRWQFTASTRQPTGLAARGSLTLAPTGWQVAGRYTATDVDLSPWGLAAPGKLQADLQGSIAQAAAPGAIDLTLTGRIDAGALAPLGLGELQTQITASASSAEWQIRRAQLQARTWGAVDFTGKGTLGRNSQPPAATLSGHWAVPGKGRVAMDATASWPEGQLPRWRLRADGRRLAPERQWLGALGASAGSRRLPPFDLALDVTGNGFELPRSATGSSARDATVASLWTINRATLDSNGSHLELRGQLGPRGQLAGQVRVADLSRWLPGQAGSLQAKFTGDDASLDRGHFSLTLEARDLANPAWPTALAAVSVTSSGEWHHETAEVQLTRLGLTPAGEWQRFGGLRLRAPATLEVRRDRLKWQDVCLEMGAQAQLGVVCTRGQWAAAAPWEVEARAEGLALAPWTRAMAGRTTPPAARVPAGTLQAALVGVATAQWSFGGSGARPGKLPANEGTFLAGITHGELAVQLAKAEVQWRRDGTAGRLPLGHAVANGTFTAGTSNTAPALAITASADAEPGLRLQLNAGTRPTNQLSWQQWPLTGNVAGKLPALDFLPAVFEDLDRVAGEVGAQLTLGGTLGMPDYRGQLRLRDGELDVVPVNLQLRQVQATLDLAPGKLQLAGTARAGAGELQTQGQFTFGGGKPLAGDMHLKGQQLLLTDVPEARVVAAPDLHFTLREEALQVAGSVQIPSARFAPQDLTGVVLPSADERIAGEQRSSSTALRTDTRVQLVLGKDVQLDTLGLTGRLQGTLTAHAPPTGTTTATGELAISAGKFKAYTRELAVEKGRLLFTGGPLADPGLDLRASRQFPGVKAGVLVRGTLRRPLVRFFSEPARTQNEIASLLVVGRSLEGLQGTGGTSSALNGNTARDTALQQGGALLAAQVGKYVGLDEVQLERDQNDAAALVLGKYLSPRLYVSYGVGLTAALSALKLRYTLGNRWVIKTEAGSRQSLDLEYTTEH